MALITVKELQALTAKDNGKRISMGESLYGVVRAGQDGEISLHVVWRYKQGGKVRQVALGTWKESATSGKDSDLLKRGPKTLKDLRLIKNKLAEDVRKGLDPIEQKATEKLKREADQAEAHQAQLDRLALNAERQARLTVKGLFKLWHDLGEKAAAVIAGLERLSHPILSDSIFQPIMRMIQKDPSPLFEFLSLSGVLSPQTAAETRLRKERDKDIKPRHCKTDRIKERSLSCVGIEQKEPLDLQPKAPALPNNCEAIKQTTTEIVELTRVRDLDQDPNAYDTTTGEFIRPPSKPKGTGRLKANAWVLDALAARM